MRLGLLSLVEAAVPACPHVFFDPVDDVPADDVMDALRLWPLFDWAEPGEMDGFQPDGWARVLSDPGVWELWERFRETRRLVADLDAFLYVMERDNRPLARDCRDDLDLIGVLGDWCEDAGLPGAAAEARYFAERVRGWRRGPGVPDTPPEFASLEME